MNDSLESVTIFTRHVWLSMESAAAIEMGINDSTESETAMRNNFYNISMALRKVFSHSGEHEWLKGKGKCVKAIF